ncbi:hypothetical protein C9994_03995 [Marivirga lumbricoides]|uniref:Uncharacterized protein n=1 Tax=Marivirga lumbricoides TaxID=1046115 RepID=A0A2T4DTT6_9BACT|nr:hypothetical protein C9994_03995 [Marivirga lumbricoides]
MITSINDAPKMTGKTLCFFIFREIEVPYNNQIWQVAIPIVKSTNVVKLPKLRNSVQDALLSASLSPKRLK